MDIEPNSQLCILPDDGGDSPNWHLSMGPQWRNEGEEGMGGYTLNNVIQVKGTDIGKTEGAEEEMMVDQVSSSSDRQPCLVPVMVDEKELEGQPFVEIGDIDEMMQRFIINPDNANQDSNDFGGICLAHVGNGGGSSGEVANSQEKNVHVHSNSFSAFQCSMCPEGFEKKLFLNNHMKNKHGVNFVFTDKGRKVKLVRLPEDENETPGTSKDGEQEQHVFEVIEGQDDHDGNKDNGEGLGCGYAVKIETAAYAKALMRKEIPFVAFFPFFSKSVYLLKIKEYGTNQLLEPATKSDVMNAFLRHNINNSPNTAGDKLPIVAFVRQIFNKTTGATDMSISSPLDMHLTLRVISQDKFTNLAFSNPTANHVELEDEQEMDDEDPIPPPKPKPKRRGRRTKKEIEEEKLIKEKEKTVQVPVVPAALSTPEVPVQNIDNPVEPVEGANLNQDAEIQGPPAEDAEEMMPRLVPIHALPDLISPNKRGFQTPKKKKTSNSASPNAELGPPVLIHKRGLQTPKRKRASNLGEELGPPELIPEGLIRIKPELLEPTQLEDEPMSIIQPKAKTPKKRKGRGKAKAKRSRSRSKPKSLGPSSPKKSKTSRSKSVDTRKVKEEPMDISQHDDNTGEREIDDEQDAEFTPSVTCAPKRAPPAGPRRRGRPRKLKFDECEDA